MAFPLAVARANDVLRAASALVRAQVPGTTTFGYRQTAAFIAAVQAYEEAANTVQPQAPRHPCMHRREAWVIQMDGSITCVDCETTISGSDHGMSNDPNQQPDPNETPDQRREREEREERERSQPQ